jgi:hypothetical protein
VNRTWYTVTRRAWYIAAGWYIVAFSGCDDSPVALPPGTSLRVQTSHGQRDFTGAFWSVKFGSQVSVLTLQPFEVLVVPSSDWRGAVVSGDWSERARWDGGGYSSGHGGGVAVRLQEPARPWADVTWTPMPQTDRDWEVVPW